MSSGQLKDSDVLAIQSSISAYADYAAAGDWDTLMNLLLENATFMPPGAPAILGHSDIRSYVDNYPKLSTFSAVANDILGSGDLAVSCGRYSLSFISPDGDEMIEQGNFIWVWVKGTSGAWKISQDIWNTDA
jgi:ketosteroid isomerase-like protein